MHTSNAKIADVPAKWALWMIFLLASHLVASLVHAAGTASLSELHRNIPGLFVGTSGIVYPQIPVADFDRDGLQDIIILGEVNGTTMAHVLGFSDGSGWIVKQTLIPGRAAYYANSPTVFTWNESDGPHLLISKYRDIYEYSGWPLTLIKTRHPSDITRFSGIVVADLDNNGSRELIMSSSDFGSTLRVYDMQTDNLLWEIPGVTQDFGNLLVAQLDDDPALEIICPNGFVIDGISRAVEWQYTEGFGLALAGGRFGGSQPRFVGLGSKLTLIQSSPWAALWDSDALHGNSIAIADMDGDSIDEILSYYQTEKPYTVRIFDVQQQSVRSDFEIPNVIGLASADFDGDGNIEFVTANSQDLSQNPTPSLHVVDGSTGNVEFTMEDNAPGYYLVAGLIHENTSTDVVFASNNNTIRRGVVTRANALSGEVRWRTPPGVPGQASTNLAARSARVTEVIGLTGPVVLLAGEYSYGVSALDAANGELLWSLDAGNTGGLPDYPYPEAIEPVDEDADGRAESILVCTRERLYQFRLDNLQPIWSSDSMTSPCTGVMTIRSGNSLVYVAITDAALRAYDSKSHEFLWSLPSTAGIEGASFIAQGVSGPELALFSGRSISFYDADSRALLRELNLPDPTRVTALSQMDGASIHELVVTFLGSLHVVDGVSGEILTSSGYLGERLGIYNQTSHFQFEADQFLVAAGSDAGVFSYQVDLRSDTIFADGFDLSPSAKGSDLASDQRGQRN